MYVVRAMMGNGYATDIIYVYICVYNDICVCIYSYRNIMRLAMCGLGLCQFYYEPSQDLCARAAHGLGMCVCVVRTG